MNAPEIITVQPNKIQYGSMKAFSDPKEALKAAHDWNQQYIYKLAGQDTYLVACQWNGMEPT